MNLIMSDAGRMKDGPALPQSCQARRGAVVKTWGCSVTSSISHECRWSNLRPKEWRLTWPSRMTYLPCLLFPEFRKRSLTSLYHYSLKPFAEVKVVSEFMLNLRLTLKLTWLCQQASGTLEAPHSHAVTLSLSLPPRAGAGAAQRWMRQFPAVFKALTSQNRWPLSEIKKLLMSPPHCLILPFPHPPW